MSKMLIDRALLEKALEALAFSCPAPLLMNKHDAAETALRAALEQGLKDFTPEMLHHTETAWKMGYDAAKLEQEEQEPVAWSTRERFCEALDRAVGNVRQEMRIKTVTMRRKDHDIALPIIDAYSGHVLVGDQPRREWQGLTEEQVIDAVREADLDWQQGWTLEESEPNRYTQLARAVEAKLKERNHE
jgi:hypothetical protein